MNAINHEQVIYYPNWCSEPRTEINNNNTEKAKQNGQSQIDGSVRLIEITKLESEVKAAHDFEHGIKRIGREQRENINSYNVRTKIELFRSSLILPRTNEQQQKKTFKMTGF